jgi:hypothetical protein
MAENVGECKRTSETAPQKAMAFCGVPSPKDKVQPKGFFVTLSTVTFALRDLESSTVVATQKRTDGSVCRPFAFLLGLSGLFLLSTAPRPLANPAAEECSGHSTVRHAEHADWSSEGVSGCPSIVLRINTL